MRVRRQGFTLIELMAAVAVVAILAAIAYPSYLDAVRKSRRADAQTALLQVQLAQAKWRANRVAYAAALSDIGVNGTTPEGYYTLAITGATALGFSATAAPTGKGGQNGDSCQAIVINQDGPDTAGSTSAACWNR